ncbi:Por secretion system C-terminal sorting domain-containing protein [Dyadobacter sp. SG02]|nr:Por secretion system C-terminal sorting domain-containing protein [Dyadobacter sp. SG02]
MLGLLLVCSARTHAQFVTGNNMFVNIGTVFSVDSLVMVPTEGLNLGDDYSLEVKYTAVPGNPNASIKKTYVFNKPVNFHGNLGIIYAPSQLNGNTESLLELANSWSDESEFVTMTGSTRDLGIHYVSKDVADLDMRMLTLVNGQSALPVTLVAFDAQKDERAVKLSWKTSSETNSDFFEIQRSRNANEWQPLGRVASARESKGQVSYDFTDGIPIAGDNYYRLKMVDRDGTFAFSQIRKVEWNSNALAVFPNPAVDVLEMDVEDWANVVCVKILNAGGSVVEEHKRVTSSNKKYVRINGFKPGNYILRVEYRGGSSASTHFVKY